jgi:tetratricopeptide (TPR) repeat protein
MQMDWLAILIATALLLFGSMATSDAQLSQSSTGVCSPNIANAAGPIRLSFSCDSIIVEKYIYKIDDAQASVISNYYNITAVALRNFLQELTGQNVPPYEAPQKLGELVVRIKSLQERLRSISVDVEFAQDLAKLQSLLDEGNLNAAETLGEQLISKSNEADRVVLQSLADRVKLQLVTGDIKLFRFKYDEAVPFYRKASTMSPPMLGRFHAQPRISLGWALFLGHGKRDEAKQAAREAISATESLLDDQQGLKLQALTLMIHILVGENDLDQIITIFRNKVKPLLATQQIGSSAISIGTCYACVAKAYINAKRYHDALDILREGEALNKKMLAPDPFAFAAIYQNMWMAYSFLRDRANASAALDNAEALLSQVVPNEIHPAFVPLYHGKAALAANDKELLVRYTRRAFEIASKIYAYDHGIYQNALNIALQEAKGNSTNIKIVYEIHMTNVKRIVEDNASVIIVDQTAEFAIELAQVGAWNEAVPYFRDVLASSETRHLRSKSIASTYFAMAQLIAENSRHGTAEEAEQYYREAISLYDEFYPIDATEPQDVRMQFLRFYLKRNRKVEAQRLFAEFTRQLGTGDNKAKTGSMILELDQLLKQKR